MRALFLLSLALATPRLFQGAFHSFTPGTVQSSTVSYPATLAQQGSLWSPGATAEVVPRGASALVVGVLAGVSLTALAVKGKQRTSGIAMQIEVSGNNRTEPKDVGRYMYGEPFAPEGMGREFINAPAVRRPLEDFVGASEEMDLVSYFSGAPIKPWDPLELHKLSKVSGNNPDVAWLREAELKHGRVAMMAFVGILITSGNTHLPLQWAKDATETGWPDALGAIQQSNPGIFAQMLATAGLIEGVSNTNRGRKENDGKSTWWDGLWFGQREGSGIVPGDLGFDPLNLMPKDEKAADLMRLKELKNGRLAMLAVMGLFVEYLNTGVAFPNY